MRRVWASHSPLVGPTSPPTGEGGLSSICWTLGLGCPICGSNCSIPMEGLCPCNFAFPLSSLPGAQVPTWSLLFPFLQPWLYRSLSASLHLVFSENFPTCRCIFDAFMGEVEFHVLLHHVDSSYDDPVLITKLKTPKHSWPSVFIWILISFSPVILQC